MTNHPNPDQRPRTPELPIVQIEEEEVKERDPDLDPMLWTLTLMRLEWAVNADEAPEDQIRALEWRMDMEAGETFLTVETADGRLHHFRREEQAADHQGWEVAEAILRASAHVVEAVRARAATLADMLGGA